jgi:hypothetical protein
MRKKQFIEVRNKPHFKVKENEPYHDFLNRLLGDLGDFDDLRGLGGLVSISGLNVLEKILP